MGDFSSQPEFKSASSAMEARVLITGLSGKSHGKISSRVFLKETLCSFVGNICSDSPVAEMAQAS